LSNQVLTVRSAPDRTRATGRGRFDHSTAVMTQPQSSDLVSKWRGYAAGLRAEAARTDNDRLRDHLLMLALRWEAMASKEATVRRERGFDRKPGSGQR
jgi:hypothetical protein